VRAPAFELDPGEVLHATVAASFRGAAIASSKATVALGSARVRHRAYEEWRHAVEVVGFPTAGPEMVLAITSRRLAVFRTSFFANRPSALAGVLELTRIADVAIARHGMVTSLAFALSNGQVAEVEAMRGARLRRFAAHVRAALDQQAR
jgi:hypothetical protein